MSRLFDFKLPDIGEGVHEGEIVQWFVKEGDAVKEDQKILEAMTDKATVEITSPRTGRIAKIHAKPGDVVKVGAVILSIEDGASAGPAKAAPAAAPALSTTKDTKDTKAEEKTLFDLPSDLSASFRKKRDAPTASSSPSSPITSPSSSKQAPRLVGGKALAAPAVRRLAREKGVNLNEVGGSGPNGRVLRTDIENFGGSAATAARPAMAAASAIAPMVGEERVPIRGLRKAIFENMRRSEDFAVPFSYWDEFDVTDLVKLRKDAGSLAEAHGVKLSYLPFIVKACVAALKEFRDINAHMDEAKLELVRSPRYNIGIATATERGLMVVVVKDADQKSIFQIAGEIESLSEKARAGKAALDDLRGSTFTITSLGKDGGLGATPVINHPEVGILGVHKIEARAKVNEKREIVVRDCMNLSGSFDHRVIDGHIAAAFVQRVGKLLSQPTLLLLHGTT
ncbi:MAG: dihydrolipoamide acetyltransferase family protein [Thermoplasmatota archaeon]